MSVVAVGPALNLDGPLPIEPPHSLLRTPGVLQEGEGRWMNGVNLWGYPSDTPDVWEPCATGTARTKTEASNEPTPRFDSFVVYLPISCSALGMPEGMEERAEAVLRATLSFGIEQALAQGVDLSSNPFFGDVNLDILGGGTAKSPAVALRYLEDAIGDTGRAGMIHLTPPVIAALNPLPETGSDLELVTANGNPVVSGAGYKGTDPVNGVTPGPTEAWAFATGPVEVRIGDMTLVPDDISAALDRTTNDVVYRAERYALAVWDTALQAGVLVDWSL